MPAEVHFFCLRRFSATLGDCFFLFSYDCQAGAAIFAAEAQACGAQCFLGELARLHWKRYPSIQALLSEAALADIDSMALMLTDNTALLEAEHAGGKRSARCREDTYLEHVMDSSAVRIVKHFAVDSKHWRHGTAAEARKKMTPHGGNAASLAARRSGRAGPSKRKRNEQTPVHQKRRKVDTKNLWMKANVSGRLATKDDHAKYMIAMQDPKVKAHYIAFAQDGNAASSYIKPKRKRSTDFLTEYALRKLRQAARRAEKPWNHKQARQQLEQSAAHAQRKEVRRSVQSMRAANARTNQELARYRKILSEYSQKASSTVQEVGLSEDIACGLTPVPHSGAPTYMWSPPSYGGNAASLAARRSDRANSVLAAMRADAEKRLTTWERCHVKMRHAWPGKIPSVTEAEKVRKNSERWCRCLCGDSRIMLIFTNTFGRVLFEVMGVQHGRKRGGHPKPEGRSVVERGLAVVRVYDGLESHWWAIAYPNFAVGAVPKAVTLRIRTLRPKAPRLQIYQMLCG